MHGNGNTKLTDQQFGKSGRSAFASPISWWLLIWRMPSPCSPCVALSLRVVRIKNENESVANVQRIMQGPTYQEKERRAATWNAAGCGSGLSESDMELVRDQSRPKDRCLAEINECVLTGDAHGTFKAAAVVGSKITNMVVKLIGSHEHMN